MTEAEWLSRNFVYTMLVGCNDMPGADRKLRRAACEFCRHFSALISDPRSHAALEYAERLASGDVAGELLDSVFRAARNAWRERLQLTPDDPNRYLGWAASDTALPTGFDAAQCVHVDIESWNIGVGEDWNADEPRQTLILRDIFGNPFRSVAFDPDWLTSTVVALSKGIYDERAFDRMPILADALQDAGCDNEDVLNHCRDENATHVRGCWVVDLVLGKS